MFHDVIVRQSGPSEFTAVVWGIPSITAKAATQGEAVDAAKQLLAEWLATAKWVRVAVPTPGYTHPALEFAGHAKDDPFFDECLDEIARYRREMDQREHEDDR